MWNTKERPSIPLPNTSRPTNTEYYKKESALSLSTIFLYVFIVATKRKYWNRLSWKQREQFKFLHATESTAGSRVSGTQ
jgi:hypothetical protein